MKYPHHTKAFVGLLGFIFIGFAFLSCESENVEEKFFGDAPGKEHYNLNVAPLLDAKCFSCHTYHNTPTTRYDTYLSAAGAIDQIVTRVTATNASIMPPVGGGTPLTAQEIEILKEFQRQVSEDMQPSDELELKLEFTAYKYPNFDDRDGVGGTFNEIYYSYKHEEANDIYSYLTDAEITITTSSVNLANNDPLRSGNVRENFFSVFTPVIHCKVLSISQSDKKAMVEISMNNFTRQVDFNIEDNGMDIHFRGKLDDIINDWGAMPALEKLAEVCGDYHEGKVWPDVDLEMSILNYEKLYE